jgi:hypothetical protein
MSDRKRRLVQFAFLGAVIGLLISQYAPLHGTPQQLAALPWTALRKTMAGHHMLAFTAVSLAVGVAINKAKNE